MKTAPAPTYVVGIDLGTSNTVAASASLTGATSEIELLPIAQLTARDEISAAPLLPSVRYHSAPGELSDDAWQ